MFARYNSNSNKYPRVFIYINSRLTYLYFSLRKDIMNYRDINILSFFVICFIINIYSDNQQTTLKYLKNTEVNLNNILIMTEDFDIRDNN